MVVIMSKFHRLLLRSVLIALFVFAPLVQAQIEIQDSHGKYRFEKPPERVVVLNWALGEQMLELGETPVGFADINAYQSHTSSIAVPEGVVDVGERLSPNLNEIRALKPDIILIGYSQRSLLRPLSNIATVIYFKNFGKRYNNHEKSKARFLEMAKLFDRTDVANAKLIERDKRFGELKTQLKNAFSNDALPTVQFIVPEGLDGSKRNSVLVFGGNSMPYYAAQELGLSVLGAAENDQFGAAKLGDKELTALLAADQSNKVCKLYLSSYAVDVKVSEESVSEDGCSVDLDYQNAFGGVMSVLYLAESISSALLSSIVGESVISH